MNKREVNFQASSALGRVPETPYWGVQTRKKLTLASRYFEEPQAHYESELSGIFGYLIAKVNLQAPRSELSGNRKRTFRHGKVNLQALLNRKQDVQEVQEVVAGCSGCACSGICGNSPHLSSPQTQIPWPYGSAVKMLGICNDQWEKLVRPLGAVWRPEECVRLARVPEETWTSAKAIHSASSELKYSYQFDVISIFKCNESVWSSKGVRR